MVKVKQFSVSDVKLVLSPWSLSSNLLSCWSWPTSSSLAAPQELGYLPVVNRRMIWLYDHHNMFMLKLIRKQKMNNRNIRRSNNNSKLNSEVEVLSSFLLKFKQYQPMYYWYKTNIIFWQQYENVRNMHIAHCKRFRF